MWKFLFFIGYLQKSYAGEGMQGWEKKWVPWFVDWLLDWPTYQTMLLQPFRHQKRPIKQIK